MPEPFPSPAVPASSRTGVFGRYPDYFRPRVPEEIEAMPPAELRRSGLPSGWTPLELVKHLLKKYARHLGRLDIVTELATGLAEG